MPSKAKESSILRDQCSALDQRSKRNQVFIVEWTW